MSLFPMTTEREGIAQGRKWRVLWVIDDGLPKEEKGFECPPNDGVWWFPALGFSTSGVYETKEAACARAREKAEALLAKVIDISSKP